MSFLSRALLIVGLIYWLSPLGGTPDLASLAAPAGEKAMTEALAWCRDKPADCAALMQQGQQSMSRSLKH